MEENLQRPTPVRKSKLYYVAGLIVVCILMHKEAFKRIKTQIARDKRGY